MDKFAIMAGVVCHQFGLADELAVDFTELHKRDQMRDTVQSWLRWMAAPGGSAWPKTTEEAAQLANAMVEATSLRLLPLLYVGGEPITGDTLAGVLDLFMRPENLRLYVEQYTKLGHLPSTDRSFKMFLLACNRAVQLAPPGMEMTEVGLKVRALHERLTWPRVQTQRGEDGKRRGGMEI